MHVLKIYGSYIIKFHRLLILDYVTSVVGVCSLMDVTLLHGHAEEANCCWSWRTSKTCRMSHSFCRSITDSDRSRSLSLSTSWLWCVTKRSWFIMSRFPTLSRFTWFLKFSKCFCFLMRDRRADSRFDIIRLRFRSSTIGGSSEPELELFRFRFSSFEPEFELICIGLELSEPELEKTGSCVGSRPKTGSSCWNGKVGSWQYQGVKPPSKAGKGVPKNPSEDNIAGKLDNMAGKLLTNMGGR